MIDHHSVRLTILLINRLAENNVAVVFCNERHMPVTMLMDLDSNSVQTRHFKAQIEASQPLKKQIWKQIVEAKIRNQSLLLEKLGRGIGILDSYKSSVKSGDSTNREGISAKVYWRSLMGKGFTRDRMGEPPNDMFNYGYALLRSAVARALMNSGLLPTLGLFHRSCYNSFPLADDIMEGYRPFVDERIYELYATGKCKIDRNFKRFMAEMFYERIKSDDLSKTTYSLAMMLVGEGKVIYYPKLT